MASIGLDWLLTAATMKADNSSHKQPGKPTEPKMHTNNKPAIINRAPVISRIGGEDHFAELSFLPIGAGMVEMVCTRVQYDEFTGKYIRDVIDSAEVEEEDAENVAVDFQYAVKEVLGDGYYAMPADPCCFGVAVDRELMAIYSVAAE